MALSPIIELFENTTGRSRNSDSGNAATLGALRNSKDPDSVNSIYRIVHSLSLSVGLWRTTMPPSYNYNKTARHTPKPLRRCKVAKLDEKNFGYAVIESE